MNVANEQVVSQTNPPSQTHGEKRRKKTIIAAMGKPRIQSQFHGEKKWLAATT